MPEIEILLIEDNADDVALTLRALEKHNLANHVRVVRDGAEALAALDDLGTAKVILLDLKLPKVSGLEVLKAIKANPNVVLVYRSAAAPVLQFHGVARVAADESERKRVFESSPEREQNADPERKGAAIIVDLTKVEGVLKFGSDGPVFVKLH